jgi:hypothetical protein
MACSVIVYVISIGLQVTGAACIAIYWLLVSTSKLDEIVRDNHTFDGGRVGDSDKQKDELAREKIRMYKEKYQNSLSFAAIVCGYLMGVFGKAPESIREKWSCIGLVILFTLVALMALDTLAKWLAKKKERKESK